MLTMRFLTGSAFPARLEAHGSDYRMYRGRLQTPISQASAVCPYFALR